MKSSRLDDAYQLKKTKTQPKQLLNSSKELSRTTAAAAVVFIREFKSDTNSNNVLIMYERFHWFCT